MLPEEQIPGIKKQLLEQLDSSGIPNKEEIKKSIGEMDAKQLEEFLIQNNLIKPDSSDELSQESVPQSSKTGGTQQCIFCSIIEGKIPTNQIDDNRDAIAVLEINPASKGHVIIIPKQHLSESSKLPQTAFSLAKKIAKKIKTKLKPKDVTIVSSNLFGHEIINVLPVYSGETLNSKRQPASPEELEKLKKLLEKKVKPKIARKLKVTKIKEGKLWLPRRIP